MYKPTKEGKSSLIWKCDVTMTKKGQKLLLWKCHMTVDKNEKDSYTSNELKLQNHSLFFLHKNKSLLSATSILSRSPMANKTTVFMDKLTCTNDVDFCKRQDRFGQFSWFKKHSNYLDVKLKVCKKNDNKKFRLGQSVTMGEAHLCN